MSYGSRYSSGFDFPFFFVIPLLLVCCAAGLIAYEYNRGPIKLNMYFVNGTDQPYDINVNGESLTLQPMKHAMLTLEEGEIVVKSPYPEFRKTIKIEAFTREDTLSSALIFNPDQQAVLFKEFTGYGDMKVKHEDAFQLFTGKQFYHIPNVNFYFVDFPETVTVYSSRHGSTNGTRKSRIDIHREID